MATPTEVADMLAGKVSAAAEEQTKPDQVTDADQDDEILDDDQQTVDQDESDELDETAEAEEQDEDTSDDNDEAEDETSDDDSFLELDEDYLVQVRVDGEDREVSLAELRDAYAHSGAADKRMTEATEFLKTSREAHQKSVEEANKIRAASIKIVEALDKQLNAPQVQPPNEALKSTNAAAYLRQLEAYQQDQARIQQSKTMLRDVFQEQTKLYEEARQQHGQQQFSILAERLPVLNDPQLGKQAMNDIVEAGRHFGFTDEEIASGADHRMYELAYYAKKALDAEKGIVRLSDKRDEASRRRNRTLRSGKTKPQTKKTASQKKQIQLKKRAQASGKPQDVAAWMASQKGAK